MGVRITRAPSPVTSIEVSDTGGARMFSVTRDGNWVTFESSRAINVASLSLGQIDELIEGLQNMRGQSK